MKLKMILAVAAAIALTGCTIAPTISQEEIDLAKKHLHSKNALESYIVNYADGDYHKAWARSKTGRAAWAIQRFSQEDAIEHALTICRSGNEKYEKKYPCKIINLDDEWL
ncbi:hypothetical protein L4D76_09770 [Photobacterium sagamiensis]|uniref:hypothetical protein n=1 Tax=Photobacterium sagamiensis TaxID=2910241 RepID=UPI003D0FFD0F